MADECIRYVVEYDDLDTSETKEKSFDEGKLDEACAFAREIGVSGTIHCVTYREVDREMLVRFAPP